MFLGVDLTIDIMKKKIEMKYISYLIHGNYKYNRENTQVPPQPMPEIPETHLY